MRRANHTPLTSRVWSASDVVRETERTGNGGAGEWFKKRENRGQAPDGVTESRARLVESRVDGEEKTPPEEH